MVSISASRRRGCGCRAARRGSRPTGCSAPRTARSGALLRGVVGAAVQDDAEVDLAVDEELLATASWCVQKTVWRLDRVELLARRGRRPADRACRAPRRRPAARPRAWRPRWSSSGALAGKPLEVEQVGPGLRLAARRRRPSCCSRDCTTRRCSRRRIRGRTAARCGSVSTMRGVDLLEQVVLAPRPTRKSMVMSATSQSGVPLSIMARNLATFIGPSCTTWRRSPAANGSQ